MEQLHLGYMLIPQNCGVKIIWCRRKTKTETFGLENIYPDATGLNMPKNKQFSIQISPQILILQGFLYRVTCESLKKGDAKHSAPPFPKLPLEKSLWVLYNQIRSNQRIFACPLIATGN